MRTFSRLLTVCVLLAAVGAAVYVRPARAADDPAELVNAYMNALRQKDFPGLARALGLEASVDDVKSLAAKTESTVSLQWGVEGWSVSGTERDGDLAIITVQERRIFDVSPEIHKMIASRAPVLEKNIAWGHHTVTERLVLIRLNGRWQFDCYHSGQSGQSVMLTLMRLMQPGVLERPPEDLQLEVSKYINNLGYAQIGQAIAASGTVMEAAIIAVYPQLMTARAEGALTGCSSNLKNIGTALEMYSTDNSGYYPKSLKQVTRDYLRVMPTCPAAGIDTYSSGYTSAHAPDAYTFFCQGRHHTDINEPENYPQYTSTQGLLR